MNKRILTIVLTLCFCAPAFSQGFISGIGKGVKNAGKKSLPAVERRGVQMSSITRGVQQGVLRHLEQPSVTVRIPATRSNPAFEFGRKLREQQDKFRTFVYSIKESKGYPFSIRVKSAKIEAENLRENAKSYFPAKQETPEHEFYFYALAHWFHFYPSFTDAQLRDMRGFYEKTISRPDVFTSDMAFADALSSFIGISFVGDAYLAEKMVSLAKAAPEGKRFLTDFVVVRSLLNLERYDLVQELLDLRQAQERWTEQGVSKGETARVYEEVKLYQQTVKAIPVTFPEELPARNNITFSEADQRVINLMELESRAHFPETLDDYVGPKENSTETLQWFLSHKHRDFTHRK
jgi:hypothetical protein